MPVVSGLTNSRARLAVAMACDFSEIVGWLRRGLERPILPKRLGENAKRETV